MKRKRSLMLGVVVIGFLFMIMGATACIDQKVSEKAKSGDYLYPAYTEENGIRKWGLMNEKGEFVVQPAYDGVDWKAGERWVKIYANEVEQGRSVKSFDAVEQTMKVGLLDRTSGKVILAPKNLSVADFSEGLATVRVTDDKYQVIDEQGQVVFTTKDELIDSYSNGVVKFKKNGEPCYGYLDQKGKVVIEPVYQEAGDFTDGKALVTITEGEQALIDLNGKVLKKYSFARVGGLTEGLIKYVDQDTQKWGFASLDGDEIITPAFVYADNFIDGKAIVWVDYTDFGLIDREGKDVLKPKYTNIEVLGEGKYAVSRGDMFSYFFIPKAIYNQEGKQLTDFLYYDLGQFQNGYISVCDGKETYFLDQYGQAVKDLPRVAELGRLEMDGDLIKAQFGKHIRYYAKDGTLLWSPKAAYQLGDLQIKEEKYQPSWSTLCYYPQIEGLENVVLQSTLNMRIKEGVKKNNVAEEPDEKGSFPVAINEDFTLNRYGDLLVIKYDAYIYPVGAAHGTGRIRCDHFNVQDGTYYQLSDLFQKDTPYRERITAIINQQILERNEADDASPGLEPYVGFTEEPIYELTQEELKVYLLYFEVGAPAAAGVVDFAIPYRELADIIDTEGALWNTMEVNYKGWCLRKQIHRKITDRY